MGGKWYLSEDTLREFFTTKKRSGTDPSYGGVKVYGRKKENLHFGGAK